MIRDSLYFKYAGEDSRTYGLLNVNLSRGLLQEPFTARGNIIEEKVRGRERPYFKRVEKDPLSFSVSFAFEETWDEDKIRSIARWLTLHKIYQPLQFIQEDDEYAESRIFYALVVEDTHVVHNALKQGYITLTFRCDSWWSYLPTVAIDEVTVSGTQSVILPNDGDLKLSPKIRIEVDADGPLVITNYENDEVIEFYGKASGINLLRFNGTVYDGETITIGDEIYEFDTGDGDVDEYDNILVDVSATAASATAKLEFEAGGAVKEGEAIIIGRDVYEFDVDGVYRYGNIVIDISDSVETATGVLTFTDNPSVYDYIIIGNTRYIFDRGTNQSIIKTLNHAVDAKSGFYAMINRSDDPDEYEPQKFVVAQNKDFLRVVQYTNNNPFEHPEPIDSQIIGQQPGDVIEIYNSKYRGSVETGTTTSHIVTTDTQGLRSGDLVGAVIGSELEFKKIISVSNNNSLTLEQPSLSAVPTAFYAFNRVALRVAESVAFHIPNVVVIGANMEESARNLVKAINVDGIPGVDFGIELLPNLLVEADFDEYASDEYESVVNLTSLFPGSEGNFISTTVSDGIDASFADNTLVGGEDCDVDVAISKLVSAVNDSGTEDIEAVADYNEINFTYKIAGTIGNGIVCLSNVEDAEWEKEYFEGGEDPSIATCYNALKDAIYNNSIIVTADDTYEDNILRIEHIEEGLHTNIPTQSDTFNLFWASRRLSGGRNELEAYETIFIDTERQQIESDTDTDGNRYDCFNDEFITLELGNNEIFITGNCKIRFWLQPRTIQG